MDKIEKFIKDGFLDREDQSELDIDSVIAGAHSSIKKRAIRRRAIYSSPVLIVLVMLGLTFFPWAEDTTIIPGGELLIAGWEYSWTESQDLEIDESSGDLLYDQTVDYIFDDNYHTYLDDSEDLLDAIDLEALIDYLEEV